jgi:hypothetical protein
MITSDKQYTLFANSKVYIFPNRLLVYPTILPPDYVRCECFGEYDVGGLVNRQPGAYLNLEFTWSYLLTFSATGSDDITRFLNLCEQAVKAHLESISENSNVVFTIS